MVRECQKIGKLPEVMSSKCLLCPSNGQKPTNIKLLSYEIKKKSSKSSQLSRWNQRVVDIFA